MKTKIRMNINRIRLYFEGLNIFLNNPKQTLDLLKKIVFLTFLLTNLFGCNIYLGEPPANLQLFDLRYFNDSDKSINIVTYEKEKAIDFIKINSNGSCWYNNVEIDFYGNIKNSPFKILNGSVKRDSILIISNKIEKNSNGKSFKNYISLKNPYTDIDEKSDMFNLIPSTTIRLYDFKVNQKKISTFSLNKGNYIYSHRIETSDFNNSLKMYDYEKRGL